MEAGKQLALVNSKPGSHPYDNPDIQGVPGIAAAPPGYHSNMEQAARETRAKLGQDATSATAIIRKKWKWEKEAQGSEGAGDAGAKGKST